MWVDWEGSLLAVVGGDNGAITAALQKRDESPIKSRQVVSWGHIPWDFTMRLLLCMNLNSNKRML